MNSDGGVLEVRNDRWAHWTGMNYIAEFSTTELHNAASRFLKYCFL